MATRPFGAILAALRHPVIKISPALRVQFCPSCQRQWALPQSQSSAQPKPTRRHFAAVAALAPEDNHVDSSHIMDEPSRPHPFGRESALRPLVAIRDILGNEIGGASHWEERTTAAIDDLSRVRRGQIGGG